MKRFLGWLLAPAIILAVAVPILAAAVPGINSTDKNTAGCVDCHKGGSSLSAIVTAIKGHPKVTNDSPKGCTGCHSATGKRPLAPILHKSHLNASSYLKDDTASLCTSCHKFDKTTGKWSVKGL